MPHLWIVRKTVAQPYCVCCTSICFAFALTVLMLGGVATGIFKFALDTSPASFSVKFDSIADRGDAFKSMRRHTATESPLDIERSKMAGNVVSEESFESFYSTNGWYGMNLFYEAKGNKPFEEDGIKGANIFTEASMRNIKRFEQLVRDLPSYPKICRRKKEYLNASSNPKVEWCVDDTMFVSPTLLSYPSNITIPTASIPHCCSCNNSSPVTGEVCFSTALCSKKDNELFVSIPNGKGGDESVKNIKETMSQLQRAMSCGEDSLPNVAQLKYFVASDFVKSNPPATHTTRGTFLGGGVVDMTEFEFDKNDEKSTETEQRNRFIENDWTERIWPETQNFVLDEFIPLVEKFNLEKDNDVRISGISSVHIQYEIINKGIMNAAFWSLFSFVFVFGYMVFHTRSPFLTLMGLGHVLISFPTTWCIYYLVFGIQYMGFLNFIALFVIMGIGADDIFVFVDAWKQSKLVRDPKISGSIEGRLEWTYRRAGGAMLVTSITDACAFYANCINDITVVRIFGAFVGTMVIVNYLLVVTYFPAIVILWNRWGWEESSPWSKKDAMADADQEEGVSKNNNERRQWLEVFCTDTFTPMMFSTKRRAISVVLVFLTITGFFCGMASQLSTSDKDFRAEAFPLDENLVRASSSASRFSTGGNDNAYLAFVMGMGEDGTKALDRSKADPNNPKEDGTPVFIDNIDFSSAEAQNHYVHVCDTWRTNELVNSAKYEILPSEKGVSCFIYHFRDWVVDAKGISFPVSSSDFLPLLANFTSVPSNFTCYNNPLLPSTMKKECSSFYSSMHKYPSLFEDYDQDSTGVWNNQIRWSTLSRGASSESIPLPVDAMNSKDRSMKLSVIMIEMNFTMKWDMSGLKARKIFNSLEKTQTTINNDAPTGLKGFHVNWQGADSGSKWMQMRTDEVMQTSAFYGCGISVIFALIVLAIATGNIGLAFLSFLCISCIVLCCIGFMVVAGWKFGLMEAICVTICVGFSIDFVAHLAVAYNESEDTELGRYGKVKQALSELGISVTAAAVTTCGASVFMIPNYMTPFRKIGMFICFDIIISLLFAVFMFAAMLLLVGPKDRNHCRITLQIFPKKNSAKVTNENEMKKKLDTGVEMSYINPNNKNKPVIETEVGSDKLNNGDETKKETVVI
jgi:predicted RND superfamily exporter protein